VTDIGEANVEEINLVEKGHSYGWPHREGTFEFQLDPNKFGLLPLPDNDEGYTYPIAQFDHYDADAISGGYFYRGSKHPLLKGKYVFGAIVRGHLFYLNAADIKLGSLAPIKKFRVFSQGTETSMAELADSGRVDLRIGIDQANKLYVFEKNKGQIFKIAKVTHSAKAAN
jgi:glucose/arabinose dehydrogenase